jgi:hypothetical protein
MKIWPYLMLFFLASCDTVKDPIPPQDPGNGNGDGPVLRRILLEDFTGHLCNNCPQATATGLQLQELYEDRVVLVGVHAGPSNFVAPLDPSPDGSYTTDFRTEAGNTYATTYGVNFLPVGMISRRTINGTRLHSHNAWAERVASVVEEEAAFDMWFSELNYDNGSGSVSGQVKVAVLQPTTGVHNLTIYLTEDHVVDWQLNSAVTPPNVPDYEHRHVLRANLNGTWGEELIATSANTGDTLTYQIEEQAVSNSWNMANCSLVAYIYQTTNDEVLQVVEKKIIP